MTVKLLGNANAGTSGQWANCAMFGQFTCEVSGLATEIHLYSLANANVKAALYADNGSNYPGVRLAKQDTATAVVANQWNTIPLEAPVDLVQGTKYWLAWNADAEGANTLSDYNNGLSYHYYGCTFSTWTWADPAPGGYYQGTYLKSIQAFGTTAVTISPPGIAQVVLIGTPKLTQIIKPAGIAQAITYGAPLVQIAGAPAPPSLVRKVLVTHPAIKSVTVVKDGETETVYDNLSNLNELRIEDAIELPVIPPAKLLVQTISGETWTFDIPA